MPSQSARPDRRPGAGDDRLTALVRARGPALVGYAYLLVGEQKAAEDLVQDAFVKVFTRLRAGGSPDAMEAYVRRTILTLYIDDYRRSRRWAGIRHLLVTAERHARQEDLELSADIRSALGILSAQERACVVLRFFDDLTVPQTAERMKLHPGTVKRYLHNAVVKMETLLGPLADTAEGLDEDVALLPSLPDRLPGELTHDLDRRPAARAEQRRRAPDPRAVPDDVTIRVRRGRRRRRAAVVSGLGVLTIGFAATAGALDWSALRPDLLAPRRRRRRGAARRRPHPVRDVRDRHRADDDPRSLRRDALAGRGHERHLGPVPRLFERVGTHGPGPGRAGRRADHDGAPAARPRRRRARSVPGAGRLGRAVVRGRDRCRRDAGPRRHVHRLPRPPGRRAGGSGGARLLGRHRREPCQHRLGALRDADHRPPRRERLHLRGTIPEHLVVQDGLRLVAGSEGLAPGEEAPDLSIALYNGTSSPVSAHGTGWGAVHLVQDGVVVASTIGIPERPSGPTSLPTTPWR
ncbi:sigma-70 family RNA polymerase sigma factor [Oerskovia sp. M15]